VEAVGDPQTSVDVGELVKLAAVDNELYCRTFFPKTYRVASPNFDREMWEIFDDPSIRFANILAFRGAAKTTRARTFTSKRIAYGMSHVILYIGASEPAAIRSIRWIKRQVELNKLWAGTFGLERGDKWTDNEIEIKHKLLPDHPIWIIGVGIESTQLRGINFDDYRPDLIVGDDLLQDENSASQEQRLKIGDLILGSVKNSLISRVEEPNAKMVLINTPQNREDFSQLAKNNTEFRTLEIPCWTRDTWLLPVEQQKSSWEALYPTEDLREEKKSAIRNNKLSIFTKEKEVRLTTPESSAFFSHWLTIDNQRPRDCFCVLGVDPVPPPSDRQIAKGLTNKDYEAHYVWGRKDGQYYLLEGRRSRGHDPNWTINTFFELAYKWKIARAVVESVAYQRVLKWMLEQEMKRRRQYYNVIPLVDKRSKQTRIISTLSGIASQGLLHCSVEDSVFVQQFCDYSETFSDLDDDLDASAIALSDLIQPFTEQHGAPANDDNIEDFPWQGACP
jgi:predicted phage terminase large subunit-like protein